MEIQEAIKTAKNLVADLFSGDKATNIGFEELESNDEDDVWDVTIGFSRPWDKPTLGMYDSAILQVNGRQQPGYRRTYKIVSLSKKDGKLISITNRDV